MAHPTKQNYSELFKKKGLTPRQLECAELVARGLTNQAVADELFIEVKTVKFHMTSVYQKMQTKRRSEFIVFCSRWRAQLEAKLRAKERETLPSGV